MVDTTTFEVVSQLPEQSVIEVLGANTQYSVQLKNISTKRIRVQHIEPAIDDMSLVFSRPWNLKADELPFVFGFKLHEGTIQPFPSPAPIYGFEWLAMQKSNDFQASCINITRFRKGDISNNEFGYEKTFEGFQVRSGQPHSQISHGLIFDDTGFL